MAQATYTILVKVNGQTLEGKGVKIKWGLPTREAQLAAGVMGRHYTVKPESSMVTVTLLHRDGSPTIDEIAGWQDVTLVCECDSGPTYQIDGAYVSNSIELGDEGGGISVEFTGPPAVQI
jgi:hypothetical protein